MKPSLRAVLFTLLFIGLALLINSVGNKIKNPFGAAKYVLETTIRESDDVKLLNIGSSHAESLDFSKTKIKGAYSITGGFFDILEIQTIVSYLVPQLPKLKVITIAIPYYVFEFDNSSYDDSNQSKFRERLYAITPTYIPINGDWKHLVLGKTAGLVRSDHWKPLFDRFFSFAKNEEPNNSTEKENEPELSKLESIRIQADLRIKYHQRQMSAMRKTNKNLKEECFNAFQKIADLAHQKNIRIVFYTPPYHESYSNEIQKLGIDFEQREKWISGLLDGNISYVDFSKFKDFSQNELLFKDSDHLNEEGKTNFSAFFVDSLGLSNF